MRWLQPDLSFFPTFSAVVGVHSTWWPTWMHVRGWFWDWHDSFMDFLNMSRNGKCQFMHSKSPNQMKNMELFRWWPNHVVFGSTHLGSVGPRFKNCVDVSMYPCIHVSILQVRQKVITAVQIQPIVSNCFQLFPRFCFCFFFSVSHVLFPPIPQSHIRTHRIPLLNLPCLYRVSLAIILTRYKPCCCTA